MVLIDIPFLRCWWRGGRRRRTCLSLARSMPARQFRRWLMVDEMRARQPLLCKFFTGDCYDTSIARTEVDGTSQQPRRSISMKRKTIVRWISGGMVGGALVFGSLAG